MEKFLSSFFRLSGLKYIKCQAVGLAFAPVRRGGGRGRLRVGRGGASRRPCGGRSGRVARAAARRFVHGGKRGRRCGRMAGGGSPCRRYWGAGRGAAAVGAGRTPIFYIGSGRRAARAAGIGANGGLRSGCAPTVGRNTGIGTEITGIGPVATGLSPVTGGCGRLPRARGAVRRWQNAGAAGPHIRKKVTYSVTVFPIPTSCKPEKAATRGKLQSFLLQKKQNPFWYFDFFLILGLKSCVSAVRPPWLATRANQDAPSMKTL